MSNPLNDRIANLLIEIPKLEEDRHARELFLQNYTRVEGQQPDVLENILTNQEAVARLTRVIDNKRQELISLELLMLDNSVKDLRSTTSQVDSSVKSLETTTDKLLKSSTKIERLTTLLIYVTIMLAIIAIYNAALVLEQSNPLYGSIGVIAIFGGFVYFAIRLYQAVRRGDITPLRRRNGRTLNPESATRCA